MDAGLAPEPDDLAVVADGPGVPTRTWLSVLVPTHGGERWLASTLDSLAAQTRRGFECILLDSSADGATLAVAERYRSRLDLRIERCRELGDWQSKTNRAANLAKADHICMLHQDDLWEPNRAETIAGWIAAEPDVAMHLHPSWIVDSEGCRLGLWRCPLTVDEIVPRPMLLERLLVQNFVAICAPVIRRAIFIEVGGLDRTLWYTADWDLYLKIGRAGTVRYHREALTGYRVHGGALTVCGSRNAASFAEQMTIVLDRHADAVAPPRRRAVLRRARAAIALNTALARAFHTGSGELAAALLRVLCLNPFGFYAFLRDTRLRERLVPRLRSLLAGRARRG